MWKEGQMVHFLIDNQGSFLMREKTRCQYLMNVMCVTLDNNTVDTNGPMTSLSFFKYPQWEESVLKYRYSPV